MTSLSKSLRHVALLLALSTPVIGLVTTRTAIAAPAKTQAVSIKGFAFSPQVLTVAPGTTVTWTNVDEDPHTVTANDRSFHSAALDTDDKYSFTFTKLGDYAYFCSLHPHMTGKIVVKAG
ncbi:MAG: cupredoxin family copper-binding protein [Pseudomonadota bacterium]|uniref:cupredoxin domain-containing protein n=1 Tax=Sphingomonas sp. ERG5 TaxID=1381597 RepID=UPI00054BD025|nr:cupredoxin family copper-binding protein [Sphingomonas sp. ERG5]